MLGFGWFGGPQKRNGNAAKKALGFPPLCFRRPLLEPGRVLGRSSASGGPLFSLSFYPSGAAGPGPTLFFLALGVRYSLARLAFGAAPRHWAVYFFIVLPVLSYVLLSGAPLIGLATVSTSLWGRHPGDHRRRDCGDRRRIALGILLALGRRSHMPVSGCLR